VSGSGKSSLIVDTLLSAARAELYGARLGRSLRPHRGARPDRQGHQHRPDADRAARPARTSDVHRHLHALRELYAGLSDARARGYKPGRFSFNVRGGRCEACQGDGVLRVAMHFLPGRVRHVRRRAGGKRYNRETLEVAYRGLSIADSLELTVDAASELFESIPRIARSSAPFARSASATSSSARRRPRCRAAKRSA
jgi:excinuclease ABC subunit A